MTGTADTSPAGLTCQGWGRWGQAGVFGAAELGGPCLGWRVARQLVRGLGPLGSGTDAVAQCGRARYLSSSLSHAPHGGSFLGCLPSLAALRPARSHPPWLQPDGWRVRNRSRWRRLGAERARCALPRPPGGVSQKGVSQFVQRKAETCIRAFPHSAASLEERPAGRRLCVRKVIKNYLPVKTGSNFKYPELDVHTVDKPAWAE